jgi:uncharacterized protein YndB with AHSA1/START domain
MREFSIRKEVELPATAEQVWRAIATGPGLAAWFGLMEAVDPDDPSVTAWEPGRRLEVHPPAGPDGSTHAFVYVIETRAGRTWLRFVHSGVAGDDWSDEYEDTTRAGWDMYLHTLAEYLRYFADRPATFVLAEAPPGSAGADAWPRLLRALGVPETARAGDPVALAPAAPRPTEGVLDYVAPGFLGVRTAEALYRFHGRRGLDTPIAVGHHVYGEAGGEAGDIDGGQLTKRWQGWLDETFG